MTKFISYIQLFVMSIILCLPHTNWSQTSIQRTDLTNTKWGYYVNDTCTDLYIFNEDKTFLFYECENSNDSTWGNYTFKDDTLVIEELRSNYEGYYYFGKEKTNRAKFICIVKGNEIRHLFSYGWINNRYEKLDWSPDSNYVYYIIN